MILNKWKWFSILLIIVGLVNTYFVGIVNHKFPIGLLLFPLAWYWWGKK